MKVLATILSVLLTLVGVFFMLVYPPVGLFLILLSALIYMGIHRLLRSSTDH